MNIEPFYTDEFEYVDFYAPFDYDPYDDLDLNDEFSFYFEEDDILDDGYDRYATKPVSRPRPGRPYPRPPRRRPRSYPWRPWYPWRPRPWRPRPIQPIYPRAPWGLSPIGFVADEIIDTILY